jgi:hypothetical protein
MTFSAFRRGSNVARAFQDSGLIDNFATLRENSPDYNSLLRTANRAETAKEVADIQAAYAANANQINAKTRVDTQIRAIDDQERLRDSRKFAGRLAFLGALGYGGAQFFKKQPTLDPPMPVKPSEPVNYDEFKTKLADYRSELKELMSKSIEAPNSTQLSIDSESTPAQVTGQSQDQKVSVNSSGGGKSNFGGSYSALLTPGKFTPKEMQIADLVAGTEAGPYGFSAFNQGGYDDGYGAINSGNYQKSFGKDFTNMTLNQIMDLQSGSTDYNKYPNQESWNKAGKVWAAGAYQFIPNTLKEQVRQSGFDPATTKFTPDVQTRLMLDYAKRAGSFSPWLGTTERAGKLNASERAVLNSYFP